MGPRQAPLLVLGGSGFLGAQVVLRALRRGPVVSASRAPSAVPACDDPQLERVECDGLFEGECEALLERVRPERVILCAALSRLEACEAEPALALRINAAFPGRVAMWAREHGARLVHVSTDLVFGRRTAPVRGLREADPVAPMSVYGDTKAAGERAALAHEANTLVVRLPLLFGDSLGRGLGASDSLLQALARGERPILFSDEWRTPLDVGDAAEALLELAAGDHRGILHVGGPERVDRVRLGIAVLRARGASEMQARAQLRFGLRADLGLERTRPADVSLDSSRARGLLRTRLRGVAEAL